MQCMLVVISWFILSGFAVSNRKKSTSDLTSHSSKRTIKSPRTTPKEPNPSPGDEQESHQKFFDTLLTQFHKTQCYFSATLQIASLTYNIFDTNMLMTFMLTPLATNGVLPVVFTYLMLLHRGRASLDVTILTCACWLLSSIVYWTLYRGIIPINNQITNEKERYRAYQQFMYKLSAIDECGGFSGLAVCPVNNVLGRKDITAASRKLRVLTPIIWGFSTACLVGMLAWKWAAARRKPGKDVNRHSEGAKTVEEASHQQERYYNISLLGKHTLGTIVYVVLSLCFLAGAGMQLSLLSIGTSLNMMDRTDWGFGQVVAVTVWVPPLIGYVYEEVSWYFERRSTGVGGKG
ncbi:hypothetical protein DM02DRAFT_613484 [Periconia macrospinosa]|uniref:Uncharacterized protein n=1 Tax=Periconia macrospinosa TaxID=97972 RepID=A0A2V1DWI1_9PLEO|nr:hypothetical protein DM02DRAFT_613484 [Periconia macrospinosa]